MSTLLAVIRVELQWLRLLLAVLPVLLVLSGLVAYLLGHDPTPWLLFMVTFPVLWRILGADERELLFDLLPVTRRVVAMVRGMAALLATLLLFGVLMALVAIAGALGIAEAIDPSGDWAVKAFTFFGIMLLALGVLEHLVLRLGFSRRLALSTLALLIGVFALLAGLDQLSIRLSATVTAWLLFTLGVLGYLGFIPLNVRVHERQDH
ncbi:MAG: hypothetical protein Q4D96_06645 [Propionibacteriaceae bacterium]|nr:hypothetical protein [Propionibacteriaceae bacterium]